MVELPADVEQQLRDLPDAEWTALQARIRPPDTAEAFRTAAAQHVPAGQLDAIMGIVDPSKFVDADGQIDQARVSEQLGRWLGPKEPQQQRHWGQHSGNGKAPHKAQGDDARAALAKRHGVKRDTDQPAAGGQIPRGGNARAALQRRHGAK